MVTQADIARLAKVDRTSVSKILCGIQPEHFSDTVVERVKNAAAKLGYTHKNFKNSLNIGFVFSSSASNTLKEYSDAERNIAVISGIAHVIKGSKHNLQIMNTEYDLAETRDFSRIANAADVFVLFEMSWPWTDPLFDQLDRKGKDYIVINRVDPDFRGSYLIHDSDEVYISNAVDKLVEYGHRRIAGVFSNPPHASLLAAMKQAFERHNLEFSSRNVMIFTEQKMEDCRKTCQDILDREITAVFTSNNDMAAFDLYIEFSRLGIKVPDDISILGNHKRRALIRPGFDLSSFATPWFEMGRRAAELLISKASRQNYSASLTREVLKQEFYPGDTIRKIG